jgi:hypothetical protein
MAARFIVLTQQAPEDEYTLIPVRINVEHIVAYWQYSQERSVLLVTNQDKGVFVTQTVEQIERHITTI